MKNLIPPFLQEKYEKGESRGRFESAALFFDIAGFTGMTEALMMHGKEGAEILSEIIDKLFQPVIDIIYEREGFITVFAGDGATAVFQGKSGIQSSVLSAMDIIDFFRKNTLIGTKFGGFSVSVKVGLSYGEVQWGIIGAESRKTFYFRGSAIEKCAVAEHHARKMQVILDADIKDRLRDCADLESADDGFFLLRKVNAEGAQVGTLKTVELKKEIVSQFIPDKVINYEQKGEFRDVVSVFVRFIDLKSHDSIDRFIGEILKKSDKYGGYFNHLDFGDKGSNFLVFFGAPLSYEDNLIRALDFANEIISGSASIGISSGTVYSGFIGSERHCAYTCLGDVVNLSSRIMMMTPLGEIRLSAPKEGKIPLIFDLELLGEQKFDGINYPVAIMRLRKQKQAQTRISYSERMIGREKELALLNKYIRPVYEGKFGGIIYIYGVSGIGKSRLISDFTEGLKPGVKTCLLQCDGILRNSLNPFVYFLNNYFETSSAGDNEERMKLFGIKYEEIIKELNSSKDERKTGIIKELERTRSIIGALLGLFWKDSLFEKLEPREKHENTLHALKNLFKGLSLSKPLIILLEDLHYIDNDSETAIELLTRIADDYPIILIASSRLRDDGTRPVLKDDGCLASRSIFLDRLNTCCSERLIKNILKHPVDEELNVLITSKTEGNPFYIEQFCLYLTEHDSLLLDPLQSKLRLKKRDIDIPVGIKSIIIARIDRLSWELKEAVQIASVLGREFDVKVLTTLIGLYSSALGQGDFELLIKRGEKELIWAQLNELKHIFRHVLLREAVYEMQLRTRLRELHKLAAEIIEKIHAADEQYYADIAYHYKHAGMSGKAGEYFLKAEQKEERYGNYSTAERFYEQWVMLSGDTLFESGDKILEYIYFVHLKERMAKHEQGLKMLGEIREKGAKLLKGDLLYRLNLEEASILHSKGEYDPALDLLRELERLTGSGRNADPDIQGKLFCNIANILTEKGDFDNALRYSENALKIRLKIAGVTHPALSDSYNILGNIYLLKGEYDRAVDYYQRALDTSLKVFDSEHPDIAVYYNNIGNANLNKGEYNKALEFYNRSKEIWVKTLGPEHPNTASCCSNMGICYNNKGEAGKALEHHLQALEIRLRSLGKNHPKIAMSYNSIGCIYSGRKDFDKALEYFESSVSIWKNVFGTDHPDIARCYNNIGVVYKEKGLYDKALKYYNMALDIRVKFLRPDHPDIALSYNNIGNAYYFQGEYRKALDFLQRSLSIEVKARGHHPAIVALYLDMGKACDKIGDCRKALEYYEKSAEMGESLFQPGDIQLSGLYTALSEAYCSLNDYERALDYALKALKLRHEHPGDNEDTGRAEFLCAKILYGLKRMPEAKKHLDSAIKTALKQDKEPSYAKEARNLASLL